MKSRAAVAVEAGKPLEITEVDVQGPQQGEVLVRMVATGVCHTDAFTLSGEEQADKERLYRATNDLKLALTQQRTSENHVLRYHIPIVSNRDAISTHRGRKM